MSASIVRTSSLASFLECEVPEERDRHDARRFGVTGDGKESRAVSVVTSVDTQCLYLKAVDCNSVHIASTLLLPIISDQERDRPFARRRELRKSINRSHDVSSHEAMAVRSSWRGSFKCGAETGLDHAWPNSVAAEGTFLLLAFRDTGITVWRAVIAAQAQNA